jgi:nitric oxide reductase subunit B
MNTSGLNKVIENTNTLSEKSRICRNSFKAWVQLDSNNLSDGQQLAVKYFTVAIILFFAQILFGMLAATQFIYPRFLYEILDFSVNRMIHINAMIIWMLYGFIGCVYWFIEDESGTEIVGLKLGNIAFWLLTSAVTVVVLVYLLVQIGPGKDSSLWFINEGREYIEAPRWADIGIVVVMLIFFYNVVATFSKGKWSGIAGVLTLDLGSVDIST